MKTQSEECTRAEATIVNKIWKLFSARNFFCINSSEDRITGLSKQR